ncbi:PQQ-binding-like beta-propeller repeat protein [Fulvivirgaceae bacterium BMA10]|uniref:PQQ-binding-like beta-propeller repeat protein n=1 Tax=Splendidivirga corallicola TaxID=3051826 RepID=A0ABT8KJL3_9BACT|nr:PQQ-binding-like beta-propeller repeat protein [Fulvivirgaceae bacterium BMA10]
MKKYRHLLLIVFLFACQSKGSKDLSNPYKSWSSYLGDDARTHYSELSQINKSNIGKLKIAWQYASGDASADNRSQIQCSPLVIDTILYGTNRALKLFAVHAATGKEIWKFSPENNGTFGLGVNRGVVYWDDGAHGRIIYTAGPFIYAVDALTGTIEATFGENGRVDLRKGLGRDFEKQSVMANTPGTVYQNVLIQGTTVHEGPGASPGHIRAYDLNTGEILWVFHTIPHPGEFGYDTWPEHAWEYSGGANSWAGMAIDKETGIVFAPTGSAAFDFYGGNREGQNLFANSLIALNAKTGERIWHFQFVHHDLWDRDLPAPPNLVTIKKDGKEIKAVAQVTKSGHVFVFDRMSGEPIFPIEEKSFPQSELTGETTWPTQPIPIGIPPFSRQQFTEDMVNDLFPDANANIQDFIKDTKHPVKTLKEQWAALKSDGQFIPPSEQGNIMFPGFDGGAEWGGAGYDPESGWLYVNANEMPWMFRAKKIEMVEGKGLGQMGQVLFEQQCARCHGSDRKGLDTNPSLLNLKDKLNAVQVANILQNGKGTMAPLSQLSDAEIQAISAYILEDESMEVPMELLQDADPNFLTYTLNSFGRFLDNKGYPAVKPPWGTLNAIDLNKGEIVWQVPLGEFDELTAQGIPITGTENYGGPVITKSGLLFIGATKDQRFRAFDKMTGEELWRTDLPAGGYATPITYEVDGKQYVVIACGGGKMGTHSGDVYMAFSL